MDNIEFHKVWRRSMPPAFVVKPPRRRLSTIDSKFFLPSVSVSLCKVFCASKYCLSDGYSVKAIIAVEYHFDAYAAAFSDKDFAW